MDEDDKRIIIAMYIGGTGAQLVESLCTQLKPQIEMRELQERLEILAETTPYLKEAGPRHLRSTGIEIVSLTPHGLKFAREIMNK